MKLWHVSTNSLGSKKYGYLICHLRFEFISCLGVVQSLLTEMMENIIRRKFFSGQMANVNVKCSTPKLSQHSFWRLPCFVRGFLRQASAPLCPHSPQQAGLSWEWVPKQFHSERALFHQVSKWPSFHHFVKDCAQQESTSFSNQRVLGVFCCQMPADVNVSHAWTHQTNATKTPNKNQPQK